jgi:hypothetical protein
MPKHPKRPADMMQLAKAIGEIATSEQPGDKDPASTADPAAVKRGKARAAKLSERKRKMIAKKAASTRWDRQK